MLRFIRKIIFVIFIIFVLPAGLHLAWWSAQDRPNSWRAADWSSAGILPDPSKSKEAAIYIMSARTGGMKGAVATHSWIVTKSTAANHYNRYDVVGWGKPVRKNAYDADGRWYSNAPRIVYQTTGPHAAALIPKIETAIARYRWSRPGDYTIWPGPNSNTFVATIISVVPKLDFALPSTAVGRDFPVDGDFWSIDQDRLQFSANLWGYGGFRVGKTAGIELNLLGLVAGVDFRKIGLKLPGFGTISLVGTN